MIKIDVKDFKMLYRGYGHNDFTEEALETLFEYY